YSSKTGSALDVEDFVYSSSNPAVASVDGNTITINGAGKATISATSETYPGTITKDITVNDITEATFGYFINDAAMGSVTSSTGEAAGAVASVELDTPVTLTAVANDRYEFKYWETPLGNKFEEEITVTVTSNMRCRAVFGEKPTEGNIAINFYNGNRDWLSTETVAKNTLWSAINKPSNPSILGFGFSNWAYIKNGAEKAAEATDTFAEDTNVVAKYNEVGNVVSYGTDTVAYDAKIKGETNGSPVKCWKRGDKIVSYAQEYTFFANGIADTITPVYEGEFIATPIAVLESYNGQYMLEYDVPSGYTKLEAGIIYGSDKETLKVNSYYSKAVAKNEEAHGQFTAIPNGADAEMETVARGYVIYKTADGCIGVAYSN
ncbi:MAG: Ig-like domain-containing protein, partial [Oscillospiraceae bacterium]|nr:Ig-like domain-containing protein [Oscillospiraceae bacterium]